MEQVIKRNEENGGEVIKNNVKLQKNEETTEKNKTEIASNKRTGKKKRKIMKKFHQMCNSVIAK